MKADESRVNMENHGPINCDLEKFVKSWFRIDHHHFLNDMVESMKAISPFECSRFWAHQVHLHFSFQEASQVINQIRKKSLSQFIV